MTVRLTSFPFQNTKPYPRASVSSKPPGWYGTPPATMPNAITLMNTGGRYYPNGWVDEPTGQYKYYLDRLPCTGNDILHGAAERDTRVMVYERSGHMFQNFIGEFRVEGIDRDDSFRAFVRLRRHTLPSEVGGVWADYHQTLAVAGTPRFRSESERRHYDLLCGMASRVRHEEWPFPNVSYTWQGVEKIADSIPDFTVYDDAHPGKFMIVESKFNAACKETEENVQKLRALSTVLPPLFRIVLICGHGDAMQITEYIDGVATPLTLSTLMSGPQTAKRARHILSDMCTPNRISDATAHSQVVTQDAV